MPHCVHFYNHHRAHGALGWSTPIATLQGQRHRSTQLDEELTQVDCTLLGSLTRERHPWDDREQQRKIRHRLAVLRHAEEVSGIVAATCRYCGISRQCFYKWKRRYDEFGEAGLRDGSSRPHHSPTATDPEVIAKVVYLRRSYHLGPGRISMYLARYHDVSISRRVCGGS